jgi:DNA-binding NtrC family response regulator
MTRYHWPGNVRQLAVEAGRLVVRAEAGVVHRKHLSPEVREGAQASGRDLRSAREQFERHHIRRALERNGGNRTATARELGLSRQAIVTKIRRLGLATGSGTAGSTPPGRGAVDDPSKGS